MFTEVQAKGTDIDQFSEQPIIVDEIASAIKKLHKKKAPRYDGVTSEHIILDQTDNLMYYSGKYPMGYPDPPL